MLSVLTNEILLTLTLRYKATIRNSRNVGTEEEQRNSRSVGTEGTVESGNFKSLYKN